MERSKIETLSEKDIGRKVVVKGWVDVTREHGKLVFIDVRDVSGLVQTVMFGKHKDFEKAKRVTRESCVEVIGSVSSRPKGTENKENPTGMIEIQIEDFNILNACPSPLPYDPAKEEVNEDLRLRYRYLDLRRPAMQKYLITRGKIVQEMRNFFYSRGFTEFETPILAKSTPEGARDYIVPSRVEAGKFWALPQSPQLFKQLLMVGGMERYFQIARCMRDEDLRKDRQPEFTQLDVEMSFIDQEDVFKTVEELMKDLFKKILNRDLKTPFRRIPYEEAMKKYNSDKPDLRQETGEEFAFEWIVDFPLFEYSKEEKRYVAAHHPFCMPSDLEVFEKDPTKVKGKTYDLVLNGTELLSGSIRIHIPEIQKKVFDLLGLSEEEIEKKFGFFMNAFAYGAPPHGGFAIGLDRFVQILTGASSIREVIAFPKNSEGKDVMLGAPAEVNERQLKDVHIKLDIPKAEEKDKSASTPAKKRK